MLWTDLRILVVDTGRVWWRLLPQILGLYLLGWLLSQLTLRVAVIAGDVSPWLTLALFAFNFVFLLGSTVLILPARRTRTGHPIADPGRGGRGGRPRQQLVL